MSKGKFLILGRGISGAVLSLNLLQRGIPHDIIDDPDLSRSSKVAAGLLNPLVLKRMRLVQNATDFMNTAPKFYKEWEEKSEASFYYPTPIRHIFSDNAEVNLWHEKSTLPAYDKLLGAISSFHSDKLPAPYGSGILHQCGWLDTIRFLRAHREAYEKENRELMYKAIDKQELEELSQKYRATIICNGHLMRIMFPDMDLFRPTRGEVMTIKSDEIPEDFIIHGKVFIMPIGNHLFKVGSTYHWDDLTDHISTDGLGQLKSGLAKLFKGPYELITQQAGVRPNVKDRKPLLGQIKGGSFYSFNGMGSRAVLMTPLLSNLLLDHILKGSSIPPTYNLNRFIK